MLGNLTSNSLFRAITFILGGNQDLAVFNYACADDFRKLWCFDNLQAKRIFVLWSHAALDPDLSPINAADCLSPADWAICFASQHPHAPEDWPDVLVLDLKPDLHRKVHSIAYLSTLKPDQFPWLRVETDINLASIMSWISDPAPRETVVCQMALKRFQRQIALSLGDVSHDGTYDRHSISNIIGPMILRGGKAAKQTLHSMALLRLLTTCGLVAAPETNADSPAEELHFSDYDKSIEWDSEEGKKLHLLLLDDQADHGWTDWVCECLPGAKVTAIKDPTPLVYEVLQQLKQLGTKDLRYRLRLPGLDESRQPVLLLDLRLFSGNPAGERKFYKDCLLPLVEHFSDRDDLAWPTFSSSDTKFQIALEAVKKDNLEIESLEHHEVMTWLPRALALADLSLPIILFSSTGRRSIEHALANYRNIITGFEKPRFFDSVSQSTNLAEMTKKGLLRVVNDAETLLIGRTRARQALQCLHCLVKNVSDRYNHFELYIDESGQKRNLVVGGLIAGFESLADADEFEDRLVRAGVRYFPTLAGPAPAGLPLSKAVSCQTHFEKVATQWRDEKKPLLLAHVTLDGIEPFTTPLRFLDMDFMDNRWRLAVEGIVEIFLSEIVSQLRHEDDRRTSVSVFGPTRVSLAASESEALMNQSRFGTPAQRLDDSIPIRWGNHAVAESNLFYLVCELLRGHRATVELEKAKFVRLQYMPRDCREWEIRGRGIACVVRDTDDYKTQLIRAHGNLAEWRAGLRALHYACDQILRDVVYRKPQWPSFTTAIPTFHERYDKYLRRNLIAARCLDMGRPIEALVAWSPHNVPQPGWRTGIRKASEAIGARLGLALDGLPGIAFIEVSRRLRQVVRLTSNVSVPSITMREIQVEEIPEAAQFEDQDVVANSVHGRYFLRIDNLPNTMTRFNLLAVARQAGCEATDCEIADDLDGEHRIAIVFFANEESLARAASFFKHHGWMARPFIASDRQQVATVSAGMGNRFLVKEFKYVPESAPISPKHTGFRLCVGPIRNIGNLERVTAKIRDIYPSVKSIHQLRPYRGTASHTVEYVWPANAPASLGQDTLVCGPERLHLELISDDESQSD